jgi:DNA-binding transcriptional regulator YiaG
MKKRPTKTTLGSQMVRDLKKLNEVISRGESVCDHFTCNRVILNLQPRDYTPEMVKEIRRTLRMSQPVFAQFLGASASAVKSWEQGANPVPGVACRFFDEIREKPDYWRERVRQVIVDKELVQSE